MVGLVLQCAEHVCMRSFVGLVPNREVALACKSVNLRQILGIGVSG